MSVKLLKNIGTIETDIEKLVVEKRCDLVVFPKQHLNRWTKMLSGGLAARTVEELGCATLVVA